MLFTNNIAYVRLITVRLWTKERLDMIRILLSRKLGEILIRTENAERRTKGKSEVNEKG